MEALQELINALSNGTIPDPIQPPLPQDWGSQPHRKLQSLVSQERMKLRTSNLTGTFIGLSEQKLIKILVKRERGHILGLSNFLGTHNYLRNG